MLRLAEADFNGRLGGWALVETPRQRIEAVGQHWSLVILLAAALVAVVAVVFDLRLSSEVPSPITIPQPSVATAAAPTNTVSTESVEAAEPASARSAQLPAQSQTQTAAQPQRAVTATEEPAAATTQQQANTAASASSDPESAASGDSKVELGAAAEAASEQPATEATASEVSASSSSVTVDAAEQSAEQFGTSAMVGSPESRVREYLSLDEQTALPVSFTYVVEAGDTASSVAARFGLQEATVLFNNFDVYDPNLLEVGQQLTLPPVDGLVYQVQPNDTLFALIENYQGDLELTMAFAANAVSSPDQIRIGQRLLLVQGSASVVGRASAASPSNAATAAAGAAGWNQSTFLWPVGYDKISDPFGTPRANSVGYHTGVDFTAAVGTIVGSTAPGQVTVATWDPSYGNWVELDHGGGYRSRYAHLDEIWVREGEWVGANAYIGTVGNTGNSSGAHLHFEIIVNGQAVNPLSWLE